MKTEHWDHPQSRLPSTAVTLFVAALFVIPLRFWGDQYPFIVALPIVWAVVVTIRSEVRRRQGWSELRGVTERNFPQRYRRRVISRIDHYTARCVVEGQIRDRTATERHTRVPSRCRDEDLASVA